MVQCAAGNNTDSRYSGDRLYSAHRHTGESRLRRPSDLTGTITSGQPELLDRDYNGTTTLCLLYTSDAADE